MNLLGFLNLLGNPAFMLFSTSSQAMDLVARILMGMSCLHPISGNFVAPGGTWNVWSSKHINPEIAARQHLEWQELTREGKETESLTGLTGGLEKNS